MALNLHHIRRKTTDLDIIILKPSSNQEDLKHALVDKFPEQFSVRPARKREGKRRPRFKLLLYRPQDDICPWYKKREIKVDLLLSSVRNVEAHWQGLAQKKFEVIRKLRVAPLHFVLFHKLLGREKRLMNHERPDQQQKAVDCDPPDIIRICSRMKRLGLRPLSEPSMSEAYKLRFTDRARNFTKHHPDTRWRFKKIGFEL
jgi:hypothetical protein